MATNINILLFCFLVVNHCDIIKGGNIFSSNKGEIFSDGKRNREADDPSRDGIPSHELIDDVITSERRSTISLSPRELMKLMNFKLLPRNRTIINDFLDQSFYLEVDDTIADTIDFQRRLNDATTELEIPKIDNEEVVNSLVSSVDPTRLQETSLSFFSRFKTRDSRSPIGRDASEGVFELWLEIIENTKYSPNHPIMDIFREKATNHDQIGDRQESIVVEIRGYESKSEIIILGAHLDSINSKDLKATGIAPGIDDNVSGISVLTEVLHSIVINEYHPDKTIRIIAFAAEEIGLLGSRKMAIEQQFETQEKIIAMVNFDMVGYKGSGKDMYISSDYSNMDLAQFLRLLLNHYQPDLTHDFQQCGYPCSDHASWHAYGFPAAMASELDLKQPNSTLNPYYHSSRDNYADGRIMAKYAKLALAFLAEVAKGDIKVDGET